MNVYYLNNMVDGMRLNDDIMANLLNELIYAINLTGLKTYEEYEKIVYNISLKLPKSTKTEKHAASLVLKFLLNNREAVMGLCRQNDNVDISFVHDRIVAICT